MQAREAKDGDVLRVTCGCVVRADRPNPFSKYVRVTFISECEATYGCHSVVMNRAWRNREGVMYRYLHPFCVVEELDCFLNHLVRSFGGTNEDHRNRNRPDAGARP